MREGGRLSAQPEADQRLACRRISNAGCGVIVQLLSVRKRNLNLRAQPVAITLRTLEFYREPVAGGRRDIV